MACTKTFTAELMDVSRLWERKVEELLFLRVFGVLEVKDSLDRTSMKNCKNFMHWNVAPDALPESARCWLNDYNK